jgi:hypothetical protein
MMQEGRDHTFEFDVFSDPISYLRVQTFLFRHLFSNINPSHLQEQNTFKTELPWIKRKKEEGKKGYLI